MARIPTQFDLNSVDVKPTPPETAGRDVIAAATLPYRQGAETAKELAELGLKWHEKAQQEDDFEVKKTLDEVSGEQHRVMLERSKNMEADGGRFADETNDLF